MNKWKLYNETKGIWEYVISDIEPTTLPDNPGDQLRSGSQVIVEEDIQYNYDDVVVAASVSLDDYKALRYHEIDAKTGTLVSSGFVYNTFTFSLSQNAQINISALNQSRDEVTYPIGYNSANDEDEYNVVDATDMHNMYLTALNTKKTILDSGSLLKSQIRVSVNRIEVNAVIDNR